MSLASLDLELTYGIWNTKDVCVYAMSVEVTGLGEDMAGGLSAECSRAAEAPCLSNRK